MFIDVIIAVCCFINTHLYVGYFLAAHVKELKYMYVLIELFREDCLPIFYNMIQKFSDVILRPWQMGFPQGDQHFTIILGAIRPMLAIMKAILSHLISARGTDVSLTHCRFRL